MLFKLMRTKKILKTELGWQNCIQLNLKTSYQIPELCLLFKQLETKNKRR